MRLLSLEVSGFRGFAGKQFFDLDADAIIVVGANGNGKTSLFDAILWALSGRVLRLGEDDSQLVCRFSDTGQARVTVRLSQTRAASPVTVTRVFDGEETKISVDTADGLLHGPEAEGRLIQMIWKEAATAANPAHALSTVLTRSVYLQQDLVRQFIDSATGQERFNAVSELVGAGRVTDLQAELEKAKAAWTKATNSKGAEVIPLKVRLSSMDSRLAELKSRPLSLENSITDSVWNTWWSELQSLGIKSGVVAMDSREVSEAIDMAIKNLDALRRSFERRSQLIEELTKDLTTIGVRTKPDPIPNKDKAVHLKQQTEESRKKIAAEQFRISETRRLQADLKEKSDQLKALATLALKHLGPTCPVCEQGYDLNSTRQRLESFVSGNGTVVGNTSFPDILPELHATLATQEKELSTVDLNLRAIEQGLREYESIQTAITKRFQELNIDHAALNPTTLVGEAGVATHLQIAIIQKLQKEGENFALKISQMGEQAAVIEMQREAEMLRGKIKEIDDDLSQRIETGEVAQKVIEALRDAASRVVTEQIKEIEPLLGEFYSRIDVHPAFRAVKFLTSVVRGRGQLSTTVSDPLSEVEVDSPGMVLSSSQLNALAVCTFLALNLGVSRTPLSAAILDDPLQSLDDINLLGLIDLLRRTKDQRQLCVSTHDVRFGHLLSRKLRPQSRDQRTIVIELDGWSRSGPSVTTRNIDCDPVQMRLVASGAGIN